MSFATAEPRHASLGHLSLNWRGAWVGGTFYQTDDAVAYRGSKYACIATTADFTPPPDDREHWRPAGGLLLLIGSARIWTPGELTTLATVTDRDYYGADAIWRENVPPQWAGVLGLGGAWDHQRQTYGGATSADLKRASLAFAAAVGAELALATEALIAGETPIEVWQTQFGRTLRRAHLAMGAFAVGGFSRLIPADLKTLFGEVRFNLRKLRRFARATEHGDARAGSEDAIRHRSTLYGDRLNTLYELIRGDSHMRARGPDGVALFTQEINVLGQADHCDKNTPEGAARPEPGCVQETARGWVPIGTLSRPGERLCTMQCKCGLKYRGDTPEN
jgi:hypothetical protein